jgi:hypothetical protein
VANKRVNIQAVVYYGFAYGKTKILHRLYLLALLQLLARFSSCLGCHGLVSFVRACRPGAITMPPSMLPRFLRLRPDIANLVLNYLRLIHNERGTPMFRRNLKRKKMISQEGICPECELAGL